MGYFVTKAGDSWEDCLNAVMGNINLIKKAGGDDYDYLFDIAESYLKEAKKKYIEHQRKCTCPILDGHKITGSSCPLHGLPLIPWDGEKL